VNGQVNAVRLLNREFMNRGIKNPKIGAMDFFGGYIQGIFSEHSGNILGTFWAHSGNIQGTLPCPAVVASHIVISSFK
jgi:hypothetical protein